MGRDQRRLSSLIGCFGCHLLDSETSPYRSSRSAHVVPFETVVLTLSSTPVCSRATTTLRPRASSAPTSSSPAVPSRLPTRPLCSLPRERCKVLVVSDLHHPQELRPLQSLVRGGTVIFNTPGWEVR